MDKNADIPQICSESENADQDDPLWYTPYRALQAAAKKLNIPANLKKQYLVDLITARELGNETVVKMLYDSAQKEKIDSTKNLGKNQVNHGKKISTTKTTTIENSSIPNPISKENLTQSSNSNKTNLKFIKISKVVSTNSKKDNAAINNENDNSKSIKQELIIDAESNKICEKIIEHSHNEVFYGNTNDYNVKSTETAFDKNNDYSENSNKEKEIENIEKLHALGNVTNLSEKKEYCPSIEEPVCVQGSSVCDENIILNKNDNGKVLTNTELPTFSKSINNELECFQNIKELKEKNNLHFIDDTPLENHDICLSENQYSNSEFLPSIDTVSSISKQQYYDQNKLTSSHSLPDEQMKILNSILNSEPLENICDQPSEFLNITDFNAGMILNKNNYCENASDIKTLNSIYNPSDFTKMQYNTPNENMINSLSETTMDPGSHQASNNYTNTSFSECGIAENYLNSNHDPLHEYDNVEPVDYNHFADALVDNFSHNFSSIENMHFNSPSNVTSKNFNMISNDSQPNHPRDDTDLSSFFNRYEMWKETFKPLTENADSVICFMCNWLGHIPEFYSHIKEKHNDKITPTVKGMVAAKINILKLASGLYPEQQQRIIERFNELYILRLKFKAPDTICAIVLRLSESSKVDNFPVIVHMQVTTYHSKKKLYWKGLVDDLIDPKRPTNVDIFANRKHGRFEVMLRDLEMVPHDINENNIDFRGLILTLNLYIQTQQDLLH